MARIVKSGLEYFPFDVDFFQDVRIRKLIRRQGGKAVTVYTLLLCLIYKDGYYMQWDKELPFIGSEMSGFDEAFISEVITTCLALGLFDKELFDKNHVLTSRSIQVRYCNIQRLNKRMGRIDKYSLLDTHTVPESPAPAKDIAMTTPQPAPTIPSQTPSDGEFIVCNGPNPIGRQQFFDEFFSEQRQCVVDELCMSMHIPIDDLKRFALDTLIEWEAVSIKPHSDWQDACSHLIAVIRKKYRDELKNTPRKTAPQNDTSKDLKAAESRAGNKYRPDEVDYSTPL